MVAHHGIDAIGCMKFIEVTTESVEFGALVVDEVTCEEDGIALLGVDEVNNLACIGFVSITQRADVQIGELGDAVAIERFGNTR